MGPGKYGIFDTFADESGRNAHLTGEIAKALFAKADDLLPNRQMWRNLKFSPQNRFAPDLLNPLCAGSRT